MTFKEKKSRETYKNFFTKTLAGGGFLRHRTAMLSAVKDGRMSPAEGLLLLLPARLSKKRKALQPRYYAYLREKASEEGKAYLSKHHPEMYDSGFRGFTDYETMELIDQVIDSDQYCTKRFLTREDANVIDAGANIGIFSILAAGKAPRGQVFAFEPAKKTYDLLVSNTKPYPNVTCFNSGLGKEDSKKKLFIKEESSGNIMQDSPAFSLGKDASRLEDVAVTSIDSFVKKNAIEHIEFIKIDTEGYEANILEGARQTIRKYKPVIAMSAYHNKNDKHDLPKLLKEIDAQYVCELHKSAEEDLVCYVP